MRFARFGLRVGYHPGLPCTLNASGFLRASPTRKNPHRFARQLGVGTIVVKILRQCTSSRLVELMAEQQDSAAAHADLEQGSYYCLHTYNVVSNRRERPCAGLCQGSIG
jgi:hypothetical protein